MTNAAQKPKRPSNVLQLVPESHANAVLLREGPYVLEITLPGLPRTANGSHGHWRVKAANVKKWKQAVFTKAWPHKPPQPLDQAVVTLTRVSSVEPDFDNMVISFKPLIDGLKQAGVIRDDKMSCIGQPKYLWQKGKPGAGKVIVHVEEAVGLSEQNTKEQR